MQDTIKIYDLQSLNLLSGKDYNIGILGGSFNPAHFGHFLISKLAIELLNLDYVIWLVARQNPFKESYKNDILQRCFYAATISNDDKILVSSIENEIDSCFTYDILSYLKEKMLKTNFTFIMGADNMENFHKWYKYDRIVDLCNIAIFSREDYGKYENFMQKFQPKVENLPKNLIKFCKISQQNNFSEIFLKFINHKKLVEAKKLIFQSNFSTLFAKKYIIFFKNLNFKLSSSEIRKKNPNLF